MRDTTLAIAAWCRAFIRHERHTAPSAGSVDRWTRLGTLANKVTLVRTVTAIGISIPAMLQASLTWLVAAYLVYWAGDMLDGWVARRRAEETQIGAVLDIVSDRACSAVLVCGLAIMQPDLWVALVIFLVQFMVVDCALSLAFLHWDLLSPNYFYRVDHRVWLLNWSPVAKTINSVGVVLAVMLGSLSLATSLATAQLALKIWSSRRVVQLGRCASRA